MHISRYMHKNIHFIFFKINLKIIVTILNNYVHTNKVKNIYNRLIVWYNSDAYNNAK